ncbi:MAG: energy-coupling factor transporter transmembrane protein EcfT [Anaerolineales bacterium]|nr:energy-coupling factor transporter transmembrane protein EcfT [Anaerolineales bacterium]MBK8824930.1 energy-coupling factor transporter transmembrane protein EcfT [Anaerolineales bacterium]
MHERLSFYVKRDSVIHRLNPLTKLTLVLALILIAFTSPWYWTPHLLVLIAIIPLSFIGKVAPEFFKTAFRLILPAAGFLFLMQAFFQPVGETVIFKFYFLDVTQESMLFAFRNAMRVIVMVSAFTFLLLTTHPSELMSDLTRRGLPGQFAYVIISTLQILPQMQAKAQTIISAQRSRGLDTESTFIKRMGSLTPLIGPLVFGSLAEVEERAIAIEARGFTSKKVKTSLYEIPDHKSDQIIRWVLILLVIVSIALNLWPS